MNEALFIVDQNPEPANVIDLRPYLEGVKLGHSVDDIHAALTNERRLQIARASMVEDIIAQAKHLT